MQEYKSNDLAFARESPAFDHQYEFNREELGVADEHLRSLTGCAAARARTWASASSARPRSSRRRR